MPPDDHAPMPEPTASPASDADPSGALERILSIQRELAALSQQVLDSAEGAKTAPPSRDQAALEELARDLLWQRGVIARHLDPAQFVDPASNLMLFLYGAGENAAPTSGECCAAAGVPRTTALRWIGILETKKLLKGVTDASDRRRTAITLTTVGRAAMHRCLVEIADSAAGAR